MSETKFSFDEKCLDLLPGDDDEWVVHISGYGTMFFRGNRADAEFFRDGKARWEGGVGYLWRLDDPTFGLDGADMVTVFARKSRTAKALAQKLAGHVVTHHNYGRAPASLTSPGGIDDGRDH